jgi:hypothetical protein
MLLQGPVLHAHASHVRCQRSTRRRFQRAAARQCCGSATPSDAASRAVVQPITPQPAPIDRATGFVANESALNKVSTAELRNAGYAACS